jgi:outer membrane biosynthesis protein TonB
MNVPAPLDQTPEERELAQRLARLGPRGEPSPQLDARVLAAARASLDPVPAPPHRSRRWPVALGLAASLVLAVGVAWRLRPLPPGSTAELATPGRPVAQVQAAPPTSEPVPAAAAAAPSATEAGANANVMEPPPPPPPEAAPRRAAKSVAAPAAELEDQVEVDAPAPDVILDVPTPAVTPQPIQKTEANQSGADAAASVHADDALDRSANSPAEPETGDEPLDAMPPATADAPGVRDAWLSRIRALIDSGDIAGGRHSLHAFVERYPDYPLPEDLRALQP